MATRPMSSKTPILATDDAATRRAKKREMDRRAQRAARERNRSRIAYLEATIQTMGEQEHGGRIAGLMNQLSDMTRQRDNLAKVLSSIERTIQVHCEGEKVEGASTNRAPQTLNAATNCQQWLGCHGTPDTPSMDIEDVALDDFNTGNAAIVWGLPASNTAGHILATEAEFNNGDPVSSSLAVAGEPNLEAFPKSPQPHGQGDGVIIPGPDSACECLASRHYPGSPGMTNTSIWRSANVALGEHELLSKDVLNKEDQMSDDIPVRVILEGWDAVERSGKLPPLWKKLRRIDSLQFRNCSDTERLAIMRLMHRLLRYQAEPTVEQCAKLPAWYLSR